jgi:superfamily I DNA and/or RNA helicase
MLPVDTYLKESRIHSEYFPAPSSDKLEFEDYREFLKDSWNLIKKVKELSKLYKECKNWKNRIESEMNAEEVYAAISEKQKDLVEKSIAAFNQFLYEKINSRKANFEQNIIAYYDDWKDDILDNLFQKIKEVMGIFVTTNLSTRYNIPNRPGLFDFVIIDEASQNDIASVLPLLFRAKHAIIIGDPNQLRHISHLKDRMVEKFAEESQLGSSLIDYHYTKVSAYDLSATAFQEYTEKSPFVLKNHYRCHHDIIQFSNREFYNSKLFPKTYLDKDISPVKPGITWRNIPGKYSDRENREEAKAIIHFIDELFRNGLKKNVSIGIITPFRNQKECLLSLLTQKRMITGKPNDQILASTVHSFQGDERDIIIYSPVLSKGINKRTQEWLDKSTELLNVAITRARCALLVFGDGDYCMQTSGLHKKLLDYCLSARESSDLPNFESNSERIFYESLKSAGFDFQYQVPIGRYRADFILKKEDGFVCIELDGSHHSQTQSYDYTRDKFFKELGYDVIRLPNNFVENDIDAIVPLLKKIIF